MITVPLTKLTCFRKFFTLFISRSNAFLRYDLNTYIVFQSFRAIPLLNTSEFLTFFKISLKKLEMLRVFSLHGNIDKDANCLQSNNNISSKNLRLLFSVSLLFLDVWFNKTGNITLRHFFFFFLFIYCFF